MITFSLKYDLEQTDPEATLRISLDALEKAYLSVACRIARNRTVLYQQKHRGSALFTRQRDPQLADLNRPISEHYQLLQKQHGPLQNRLVIAFAVSDLTANPLRPHYDASIPPEERAFQLEQAEQAVYRNSSDARLFHLEDEPIGKVPYTLLFSYEEEGQTRLAVHHQVMVKADGSLPDEVPEAIRKGLKWWAACPPLLINGKHDLERYAILDYDLRHVFGFPKGSKEEKEKELQAMYQSFPDWEEWCETVRKKLHDFKSYETGYHAALGISEHELILGPPNHHDTGSSGGTESTGGTGSGVTR